MIGPIGVTEKQAEQYLEFMVDLTDSQRVIWKITRSDGTSVMMVPVNEIPPVSEEIQNQVEEFRKNFVEGIPTDAT
tara:strand:- start:12 stop:239 length:228 start_codon:yes stop_codon:yes gene_type:complete